MPRLKPKSTAITDEDILTATKVTVQMAAEYLGVTPQTVRIWARAGKIGYPIDGTNAVYINPHKLVRFKGGTADEDRYRIITQNFIDAGFADVIAKIATAIVSIADEEITKKSKKLEDYNGDRYTPIN